MSTLYNTTAALLLACGTFLSSETAVSAQSYGKLELVLDNGDVQFIDEQPGGLSVGDIRVGSYDLIDLDGNTIGESLFQSRVVALHEGQFRMIGKVHLVFENGIVTYSLTYDLNDPTEPSLRDNKTREHQHPVTGGSGQFAGARGDVVSVVDPNDDDRVKLIVDIECLG